jgi:hypothetical protein
MKKIIILILLFSSCKKAEDRSCWKFYGATIQKTVTLENFHALEINPNLIINLIQDSTNYCVINGGENVVNLVNTEILNGKLVLKNENKCTFLRNPKMKISVDVHFIEIDHILYQGSENVKGIGLISSQNFVIEMKETSGTIDLELNTLYFSITAEPSWANFILSGTTKTASFVVKGNAYGDARNFVVEDDIVINSRTGGDCYINGTTTHLKCETNGTGNVYYTNTPSIIEWNDYATGKLLQAP